MQVPAGNSIGSYPPAINATILPVEQKTLPIVEIPATMLHPHNKCRRRFCRAPDSVDAMDLGATNGDELV
jgi:hypothetical protein